MQKVPTPVVTFGTLSAEISDYFVSNVTTGVGLFSKIMKKSKICGFEPTFVLHERLILYEDYTLLGTRLSKAEKEVSKSPENGSESVTTFTPFSTFSGRRVLSTPNLSGKEPGQSH